MYWNMYSNLARSQDLYVTNPMDHFLGPESQRNNTESGFSSGFSCNQNGSSKEVFSFPTSCDIFSQPSKEEKSDLQCHDKSAKFQNYISQNLILGSMKNTPRSIFSSRSEPSENFSAKKRNVPETSAVENNYDIIKEIRNVSEIIQKNAEKSESYMLSIKDIKEEVHNIAKDQKMLQETQKKLMRTVEENHESNQKAIEILSSKIKENTECLKQVILHVEKHDQIHDVKQDFCKKVLVEIGRERKHFEICMKNMITEISCEIHNSVADLRSNLVDTLDQKLCALRNIVSLSAENKMRTDEYLHHKNLLSRQNITTVDNFPSIASTNYASSKSKPNFEDDYKFNSNRLNSEKCLMYASTYPREHSRKVLHTGITSQDSSMLHKMLGNEFKKPSSCNSLNFGIKSDLKDTYKKKVGGKRQNASCSSDDPIALPKTQMKNVKRNASQSVANCNEMQYKGKLRSSKKKILSSKRSPISSAKKKKNNAARNKKQKKNQDVIPQNQNKRNKSTKSVKKPVIKKFESSSRTITTAGNLTNCTLFSSSFCSSPGMSVYEAVNLKKQVQYFR